jgi:hypothetical protein
VSLTISELITKLQAIQAEHGDLPVRVGAYDVQADEIIVIEAGHWRHDEQYIGLNDWPKRVDLLGS